jgi:hypothetical protein
VSANARLWTVAAIGAAIIAGAGFGTAWLWGEGAGMPIVALGSTLWTAGFARWSTKHFGA